MPSLGWLAVPLTRPDDRSAAQPLTQQLLALLGALAALGLGLAEEGGELGVALAFGVLDVGLQPQGVAQAGLGEPDDVVVLVLGAGDLSSFAAGHVRLLGIIRLSASLPPTRKLKSAPAGCTRPWARLAVGSGGGLRCPSFETLDGPL